MIFPAQLNLIILEKYIVPIFFIALDQIRAGKNLFIGIIIPEDKKMRDGMNE